MYSRQYWVGAHSHHLTPADDAALRAFTLQCLFHAQANQSTSGLILSAQSIPGLSLCPLRSCLRLIRLPVEEDVFYNALIRSVHSAVLIVNRAHSKNE